jgi:hypothetical protein
MSATRARANGTSQGSLIQIVNDHSFDEKRAYTYSFGQSWLP